MSNLLSPLPWRVESFGETVIVDADNNTVAIDLYNNDARHIVQCVNFCEGLTREQMTEPAIQTFELFNTLLEQTKEENALMRSMLRYIYNQTWTLGGINECLVHLNLQDRDLIYKLLNGVK